MSTFIFAVALMQSPLPPGLVAESVKRAAELRALGPIAAEEYTMPRTAIVFLDNYGDVPVALRGQIVEFDVSWALFPLTPESLDYLYGQPLALTPGSYHVCNFGNKTVEDLPGDNHGASVYSGYYFLEDSTGQEWYVEWVGTYDLEDAQVGQLYIRLTLTFTPIE